MTTIETPLSSPWANSVMAKKKKQTEQTRQIATGAAPSNKVGRVRKKLPVTEPIEPAPEEQSDFCVACGSPLLFLDETRLCARCNSEETIQLSTALSSIIYRPSDEESQLIECPGATVYDEETGMISEGADFIEHEDGSYETKIIKRPHFPTGHKRRRLVKRSAFGKIRRCQACQDYTVRIRRREGVDFCIPSSKFPRRTKLKSVDHISHRPDS